MALLNSLRVLLEPSVKFYNPVFPKAKYFLVSSYPLTLPAVNPATM